MILPTIVYSESQLISKLLRYIWIYYNRIKLDFWKKTLNGSNK